MKIPKKLIEIMNISKKNKNFIINNKLYKLDNKKYQIMSSNLFLEHLFNDLKDIKYDDKDRITEVNFEDKINNYYQYDDKDRIIERKIETKEGDTIIQYKYDDEDRIIEKNDCGNITRYEYDDKYEYEIRGKVKIKTDLEYDEVVEIATEDNNSIFKLEELEDGYNYYDANGELVKEVRFDGSRKYITETVSKTKKTETYENDMIISLEYEGANKIQYKYDDNKNLIGAYKQPLKNSKNLTVIKDGRVGIKVKNDKTGKETNLSMMEIYCEYKHGGVLHGMTEEKTGDIFKVVKR